MKVKLFLNNIEVEADISEEDLEKVMSSQKKTGYERVENSSYYYYEEYDGSVEPVEDRYCKDDDSSYKNANYYSDKTVAENNARADKLMRKMRRFAVEHRASPLNWTNSGQNKYYIYYDHKDEEIYVSDNQIHKSLGSIHFDTKETAWSAATAFADELVWYFTEYKDSL